MDASKIKTYLALFLFPLAIFASEIATGTTEKELLVQKGEPEGKMVAGNKTIYRWADSQITVRDGLVVEIVSRDTNSEKNESARRNKLNDELAETRRVKEEKEAAERAIFAEQMRVAREKAAEEKMRRDAAESVRLQKEQLKVQQEILRQSKIDAGNRAASLKAEIAAAQQAAQRAKSYGDSATYNAQMDIVYAKQRELNSTK